jgi:sugar phosphate isomerase/epimerase
MYRNLNPMALGITGRQSELIELALTYGFAGLDLQMAAIVRRARSGGKEQACRFMTSANLRGGEFELPVRLSAPEMAFRSSLTELEEYADVASELQSAGCRAWIVPALETMPYQEGFELHRARLSEIAEVLAKHQIRLGLAFHGSPARRPEDQTPFIHNGESLMTLIRTIGQPNVGVALDPWNWMVSGATLEDLLQIPVDSIVSVALADLPADSDLATATDQDRCLPGESGRVDCQALVQHLKASNYEGPITLAPDPSRLVGMTRDAIVQQARATLGDLINPAPPVETSEPAEAERSVEADVSAE